MSGGVPGGSSSGSATAPEHVHPPESGSPQWLLRHARELAAYDDPATVGLWPRAAALLARQALESAVHDYWSARAPGTERCSLRAQLGCLGRYAGEALGEQARFLHGVLSEACHYHAYELAPSAAELAAWIEGVDQVARALGEASEPPH